LLLLLLFLLAGGVDVGREELLPFDPLAFALLLLLWWWWVPLLWPFALRLAVLGSTGTVIWRDCPGIESIGHRTLTIWFPA
jgi:hypothetical protein